MTVPLILKRLTDRHIWNEIQKQKPTLFLTKQCWSPRYKVPVLSTYGGCHPEGFIVASFYNFKGYLHYKIIFCYKVAFDV